MKKNVSRGGPVTRNAITRTLAVFTFFTLFIFCASIHAMAYAAITITGKIINEKNEPLPGVSIKIKGSFNGTTTDASGTFKITADENAVLQISYVGFANQEVAVNK